MKAHSFRLVLAGVPEITPDLAEALYGATECEIEFEMRNGVATLDVQRRAKSLRDAILSTIHEVESTEAGVRVVRVESEAANTIVQINAELLSVAS